MIVYKVGNVYYNEDSIQQYIQNNHSFADFVETNLKDKSGNLKDIINNMFLVWNGDNPNEAGNYLNILNCMYVSYVNGILSGIPTFTLLEGGQESKESNTVNKDVEDNKEPDIILPENNKDE